MGDGHGEILLNDFELLDPQELPSQTVFPAHLGADRATAEVPLDRAIVRTRWWFRSSRPHAHKFPNKKRISDGFKFPTSSPVRGISNRKANQT